MTDRTFIWLAVACYAVAGALTFWRLRGREAHPLNYALMLAGFALQTTFLYWRGQNLQRCPLTNTFETTVFIAWAAVLFYLLIGPAYRVSFLGAFSAPLAVALGLIALLGLNDSPRVTPLSRSAWVDFHAGIAILACGAFGLAFVAGIMYLVQERQLKSRKLSSSFLLLPPIEQLDVINYRLVLLGFIMLTAGMIGGFISYRIVGHWTRPKIVWAVVVWLLYGSLVAARHRWSVRGRRSALISVVLFALVLITFWGLNALR
jgi:ABC-type transport system involved in cytochrome c biogenesis permease subunit